MSATGKTLFEKIWQKHVVQINNSSTVAEDTKKLIYIDLHLVHEVTSPQAFEGLRLANRKVRRPDLTYATMDHNIPTTDRTKPVSDPVSAKQMNYLQNNADEFGITVYNMQSYDQGIVHVIGPELGLTLPGKTIVCGDSHTSTHGAFGALAFGIGTSEVEHVLATQCLLQAKPKTMKVNFKGNTGNGVTAKDMILALIGKIGTAGATGYVLEYTGEAIENLSMEGRMTICNMSIEAGARAGMIAPDEKTFEYIKNTQYAPKDQEWDAAVEYWQSLKTDDGAVFDAEVDIDCSEIAPQITWGTSPGMVIGVNENIPSPEQGKTDSEKKSIEKALSYMGLEPGIPVEEIKINKVFIGSCTNSRIEDLREAAGAVKGRRKAANVEQVLVVPGSHRVKDQAEKEGLHKIFIEAGFEWREPGCSMCLAMNDDVLKEGDRCASTSNRNFEGRQGKGSRTHLVSPAMAAVAAVNGHFTDIRKEN